MKSKNQVILLISLIGPVLMSCADQPATGYEAFASPEEVRIMTLNPGHFHAALIQKTMLDQVSDTVYVYAPGGTDLELHLDRIEGFNTRSDDPTSWQTVVYTESDYLERMLDDRPGNVMVTAGNNRLKTDYIKRTVDAGIHVLSDKPMAIDSEGWGLLQSAFASAEDNHVLLYDIMTERYEVTSAIQRMLAGREDLFGQLEEGSVEAPAIVKESVHHLFKYVAGSPLRRPAWYFDVNQQGEGIVDVTTHLVDLSMWGAFPDHAFDYESDVELLQARRWPTVVTRPQFERITAEPRFPDYLRDQLNEDGSLPLYANGEILYTLNGVHTRVSVQWDYQAPEGGDDSHFSVMRGTRSDLVIRQGPEQNFRSTLYVEPAPDASRTEVQEALVRAVHALQGDYSGLSIEDAENGWKLVIPDEYHLGHEAHFGKVAEKYFGFLAEGRMPHWEVPNMITKYYITSQARELALEAGETEVAVQQ